MREIKFKLWHKEEKKMYWFDLMWGRSGRSGSGWLDAVPFGEEREYSRATFGDNRVGVDPDECEILQYTGLKDKNGKEIYEGDVVKQRFVGFDLESESDTPVKVYEDRVSFIEYRHHGFWVSAENFGWEGENLWDWDIMEVIGNIYEQPNLLNP